MSALDRYMRRVLGELETLSTVSAPAEQNGGRGKPGSTAPVGETDPPHEFYRRRFVRCRTDEQRRLVVEDALRVLLETRYSPDRSKRRGTKEWREAIAHDERSAMVVAHAYAVNRKTVLSFRRLHRRKEAA